MLLSITAVAEGGVSWRVRPTMSTGILRPRPACGIMYAMPLSRATPIPLRRAALSLLTLPLVACGGADPEPSGAFPALASPSLPSVAEGVDQTGVPRLINVLVTAGTVGGVASEIDLPLNTPVRLTVISDEPDVLLVRGYNLRAQLSADEPVQVEFIASRAGDAEVVLERSGLVLTTLRVS